MFLRPRRPNSRCRGLQPCVANPRPASIGEHFDALPSGGIGHAELHALGFSGERFKDAEQHVPCLALFDAVVFKHQA